MQPQIWEWRLLMRTEWDCDVVVVGGGPGGSAAASTLSRLGHRVVLLEREQFPRFHIGESQLPWLNEILAKIGALEAVRAAGFVHKWGASFAPPDGGLEQYADFERAFEVPTPQTFQVPRAEFDELLLTHAATCGGQVLRGRVATAAVFDDAGVNVTHAGTDGEGVTVRAGAVIDASGRAGFLSKEFGERRRDPVLRNISVHRQYTGVPRASGRRAGDIRMITRDDRGWFWFIPISKTVTSVGVVIPQTVYQTQAKPTPEETLTHLLAQVEPASRMMANAVPVTQARFDAGFSYLHTRHAADRCLIVGDAGAFLDPIFSTGVLMAMQSGIEAAEALSAGLRADDLSAASFASYERILVKRYRHFRRFAVGFYDAAFRELFFSRSSRFGVYESVLSVLGGNWRPSLRTRVGLRMFFVIVAMRRLGMSLRRPATQPSSGRSD